MVRDYWNRFLEEDPAHARGESLLREWLSPNQRAQYDALGYFDVVGCHTGKTYRIWQGTSTNVEELDKNGVARICWCFVPKGYLVEGDVMLAQKISLETNERAALAAANRFTPATGAPRRGPQVNRRPF
jgi:hypothetical protein